MLLFLYLHMTFIEKTQKIREEGAIHWTLLLRIRIFLVLSFLMGFIFVYNILFEDLNVLLALLFALFGFLLSYMWFSRTVSIDWNEKGKIAFTKFDIVAVLFFVAYVCLEYILHYVVQDLYPTITILVVLSIIFGSMAGRTLALSLKINNLYEQSSKNK